MRKTLGFVAVAGADVVREIHAGEVSRKEAQALAADHGFPSTCGYEAHKLIRAHDNVDMFIDFYVHGRVQECVEPAASSPAIKGNTAQLKAIYPNGRPVVTVEDLFRVTEFDADPDEWEIVDPGLNSYGTTMKVGPKGAERVVYVNNFQVKPRLQRKEIEPEFPMPRPISLDVSELPEPPVKRIDVGKPDGWETALVLMDRQTSFRRDEQTGDLIPHHDRSCIDLAVQVAGLVQPDRIVDVGDALDFTHISKYVNTPDMARMIEPANAELAYDNARLMQAAGTDRFQWIEGNHEIRLNNLLQDKAPELWAVRGVEGIKDNGPPALSVPGLLGLREAGIDWIGGYPDNEVRVNDGLVIRHGNVAKRRSGETVKAVLQDQTAEHSTLFGHIHRWEIAWFTNWIGQQRREFFAASLGCMCDLQGEVQGVKSRQNWQQGFGLIHYDPNGWKHVLEPIKVYDGQAWFRGRRLEARAPDLDALSRSTGIRFTRSQVAA